MCYVERQVPGFAPFYSCIANRISMRASRQTPQRNGVVREMVPTSPILLEYTTFMKGVDVTDQIRASYSNQSRSHKWWHRIFWALLDITEVNMYIMYVHACQRRPDDASTPMSHLEFKNAFYEALLLGWP